MLIYAEDLASPYYRYSSSYSRFGADAVQPRSRWCPDLVPYAEMFTTLSTGTSGAVLNEPGIAGGTELESGRRAEGYVSASHIIYLPRSRNLTQGFLLFERNGLAAAILKLEFRSYLNNSSTYIVNFVVNLSIDTNRQRATFTFATGGSGYPNISSETVYYDFTQPFWLWVQCDMPTAMSAEGNGTCRVWLNNDLVITKENILTGNIDAWVAQPLYEYNNAVYVGDARHWTVYSLAAVNEGLGYMDSALGDINIAGLLPELAETSQWFSHHDGMNLETAPEDVLKDNLHTDYANLHTNAHIRADDHLMQSMFRHQNPFHQDAHIIAVAHRIVHRKHDIGGSTVKLRIEPIVQTSGRPAEMDRSKGQSVSTNAKTLFVPYTKPYAGAYWSKELLDLTTFGFAYFDTARTAIVQEQVDLLGEYDVENLDDGLELVSGADVGISEFLNDGMGLAIETTAGDVA